MAWKDWPYWMRGSIVCEIILIWLFILYGIMFFFQRPYNVQTAEVYFHDFFLVFISTSLFSILVGALFGGIYGKIKRKTNDRLDAQQKSQKSWSYWLKGGLIVGVMGFPVALMIILFMMANSSGIFPGLSASGKEAFNPYLFLMLFLFIGVPITALFFGIGSLIGWKIEKIKVKKSE